MPSHFQGEVDERGHRTSPAACFVPRESEPHAGGEVGRSQAGHETGPAACFEPAESERAATKGSPGGTGREVGRSQWGIETSPAACLKPHESERAATAGSPCRTGREVDSREYIFWQTPASAGIADRKYLMSAAGARVCGLVAIEKVSIAHALVAGSFGYRLPMVQSGAEQVLFNELWWVSGSTQAATRWGKSRNLIPVRPEPAEGLIGPQ